MINLGVAGYGYWGRNLVREFAKLNDVTLDTICDINSENLREAHHNYAEVKLTNHYVDLINDNGIDAVVIATPISSHYELALTAIKAGKHVLVEKPMATHLQEAFAIQEQAESKHNVVMVDYTPVYSSAAQTLHHLIQQGELGHIIYFDSIRTNYGSNDLKSSVIWDLAVHDLALINYLISAKPIAVSAVSENYFDSKIPTIAYITLFFEDNVIAHIYVNDITPEKLRHITIAGNKKVAVFDDCLVQDKVKLYDIGIDDIINQQKYTAIKTHTFDAAHALTVGHNDGLTMMAAHFVDCIDHHKIPQTDSQSSIKLIHILESIEKSIHLHGAEILLDQSIL